MECPNSESNETEVSVNICENIVVQKEDEINDLLKVLKDVVTNIPGKTNHFKT